MCKATEIQCEDLSSDRSHLFIMGSAYSGCIYSPEKASIASKPFESGGLVMIWLMPLMLINARLNAAAQLLQSLFLSAACCLSHFMILEDIFPGTASLLKVHLETFDVDWSSGIFDGLTGPTLHHPRSTQGELGQYSYPVFLSSGDCRTFVDFV